MLLVGLGALLCWLTVGCWAVALIFKDCRSAESWAELLEMAWVVLSLIPGGPVSLVAVVVVRREAGLEDF